MLARRCLLAHCARRAATDRAFGAIPAPRRHLTGAPCTATAGPLRSPRPRVAMRRAAYAVSAAVGSAVFAAAVSAAPVAPEAPQVVTPQRPYLIFNPVAGQEPPDQMLGRIALKLAGSYPQLTVMQTRPDVHAEALAARALEQGADLVVAR